jgi:hypothetical protein
MHCYFNPVFWNPDSGAGIVISYGFLPQQGRSYEYFSTASRPATGSPNLVSSATWRVFP